MPARISTAMLNAIEMIRNGATASEAADACGLTRGAISKNADCIALLWQTKAKAKRGPKPGTPRPPRKKPAVEGLDFGFFEEGKHD